MKAITLPEALNANVPERSLSAVYGEMGDTTRAQQTLQRSVELLRQTGFTDEAEKVNEKLGKLTVS